MNYRPVSAHRVLAGFVHAAALMLLLAQAAHAQGTRADYERAEKLRGLTNNKVFRDRVQPQWLEDGTHFWYSVRTNSEQREYVMVDCVAATRQPAFDHAKLADTLKAKGVQNAAADRLQLDALHFRLAEQQLDFRVAGKRWRCDLRDYGLAELPRDASEKGDGDLLPVESGPKASTRTGPETSVTFSNRMQDAIELVWLDPDGERKSYGSVKPGEDRSQHTFAGHVWMVLDREGKPLGVFAAREGDSVVEVTGPATDARGPRMRRGPANEGEQSQRPRRPGRNERSPDGQWTALVKDFNVWIKPASGDEEFALSKDGTAEDSYGDRFFWSDDSSKLVAVRTRQAEERQVYFIESSPSDQVQPKLHSNPYRKPGDPLPVDRPCLFDIASKAAIPISDTLFANPWSIEDFRWQEDSSRFTFVFNQRGHQALRVLSVAASSGQVSTIVDEKSDTFIDYSGKYFLHWLPKTDELIWMSERDGWNHLYLYDAATGQVKNQITKGEWVIRGVERVDESARQVWFRASGMYAGQDPYFIHFGRVNFDGTGLVILTEGDGTHSVKFSPDGRFLIDTYSRVDLPPVTEVRKTEDGKSVVELERADWKQLLDTGWQPPERFTAKGRDGTTDIYGVIFRPTSFNPQNKYPVIESIYAGPQDSFVPKGFRPHYGEQSMAELGFIVVKIDGMGTSNRSKKFHDVCWKNLKDAGLPDRILWIKAAASKYPWLDISRVGVYGGSAGGQNAAAAVMTHGDFYKAAVADCGCHDNRMDKIWWNEQWMGWPIGPEYEANSNVTLARGLTGKLFLIVGEMDTNVDPASTMQVVNALIKADKDFDLLVVPGSNHGAAEKPYASRRRADYFVRHLLGVEPRREP